MHKNNVHNKNESTTQNCQEFEFVTHPVSHL